MSDDKLSQEEIEALLAGDQGATPVAPDGGAGGDEVMDASLEAPVKMQAEAEPQAGPSFASGAASAVDIRMSTNPEPDVKRAEFGQLSGPSATGTRNGVDLLLDVQLNISVELGRANLHVRDVLGLGPGAVVELDKHSGEPVEVMVNGKLLARGEVVLIDENFGVRITEIASKPERESHAKAA